MVPSSRVALFLLSQLGLFSHCFSKPTIPLPRGFLPEGIAAYKRNLYVGSLSSGAVVRLDVAERRSVPQVAGSPPRVVAGMAVSGNLLFAAGSTGNTGMSNRGPPGLFYVFDLARNVTLATCRVPEAAFVNDAVVHKGVAYFTDSAMPVAIVVPVATAAFCRYSLLSLPRAFEARTPTEFRGNGIVFFQSRLLIANSFLGTVFAIDLKNRARPHKILPQSSLLGADGLELRKDQLFVIENGGGTKNYQVSEWKLRIRKSGRLRATKLRAIRDARFETPTTGAIRGNTMWVVNSRFGQISFANLSMEDFNVVPVPIGPIR